MFPKPSERAVAQLTNREDSLNLDDVLEITLGVGPSHPGQSGEAKALPARHSRLEVD